MVGKSLLYSLVFCLFVLTVSLPAVESYRIGKVVSSRSRPYDFQTTTNIRTTPGKSRSRTIMMSPSMQEDHVPACPPRSQNCIRTTWKVPSGTKDAYAGVVQLFKSYPQEGQDGVDKGGWTIVEENRKDNTLRLEYKSGIGMFARFLNGGKPFVDDVLVKVVNNSIVAIRSSSRIGQSDLGVNKKRLQFLATKARELGWEVPDPTY